MTSNPNDNNKLLMTVIEALNVCESDGMKNLLEKGCFIITLAFGAAVFI